MRTEKWKLPSVWVLGPIGLEETRGPPVFGVINAVLKVTARPKHVITRGGSVQCGLDSTATLGEQNFKWEKRPLESHGVVISMSKSNHQKFWFASPMLIGTLVTSVNPVKIYIYVNFNVKGLINFITWYSKIPNLAPRVSQTPKRANPNCCQVARTLMKCFATVLAWSPMASGTQQPQPGCFRFDSTHVRMNDQLLEAVQWSNLHCTLLFCVCSIWNQIHSKRLSNHHQHHLISYGNRWNIMDIMGPTSDNSEIYITYVFVCTVHRMPAVVPNHGRWWWHATWLADVHLPL